MPGTAPWDTNRPWTDRRSLAPSLGRRWVKYDVTNQHEYDPHPDVRRFDFYEIRCTPDTWREVDGNTGNPLSGAAGRFRPIPT